jgi:hypothetical protein
MKKPSLERWIGQLLATQDNEISCSDCFDSLSEYVDRELAQKEPDTRMQRLEQHLGQCRVCREEYEMLRELVSNETGGANQSLA